MTAPNEAARFPRGARVRMTRRWNPEIARRADVHDFTLEGVVVSWGPVDRPGEGALLLTGVPAGREGWWAAPSCDVNGTTTLELITPPSPEEIR